MFAIPVKAQTPTTTYPVGDILPPTAPLTMDALIAQSAQKWGANARIMAQIIKCESGGYRYAIGDHGTSFGLVQIHLPAHPDITKAEAFDPTFSIDYLAHQLSLGNGRAWTCYGG